MDIAIFGAGIAGLTAAVSLRAQGHRCRVYERSRTAFDTGMGFIVMAAGMDYLQEMGLCLRETVSRIALRLYCHRDAAGEIQHEQSMPAGACAVRRRDLLEALLRLLPQEMVLIGTGLETLEFDAAGAVSSAWLNSGEQIHADLYIAADGVHSVARRALFPDWQAPSARVHEMVGLAECAHTVAWAKRHFNKFHACEGGVGFGVLPAGGNTLIWYLQFDTGRFPPPAQDAQSRHAFVTRLVGDWAHPVPHLLAITDFEKVHVWRPVDADLVPRFHCPNLALVGDAAHPFLPFSSQGVSSAIADTVVLTDALNAEDDLGSALACYSTERRAQCLPYIAKGRELSRHFLAPHVAGGAVLPLAQ